MFACCLLLSVWAEGPSLRQLCIDSPTVAVGAVVDPVLPTAFRVTRVFRGTLKVGDNVRPDNLAASSLRTYDDPDFAGDGKPRPRRSEQALLFLDAAGAVRGLRLLTEDGRTMALDDGKLVLVPSRWSVLLERVREDLLTVDRLTAARALKHPEKRTRALLTWIERHRDDLCAPSAGGDEDPIGWGSLRISLFDAIFDTNDATCAWAAVRTHARLFGGELLRPRHNVFATEAGKKLLLGVATNPDALSGDRGRAVTLIGPTEELIALLGDGDELVRVTVARTLGTAATPAIKEALTSAYKTARPGPFRDELAWVMNEPGRVVAVLRDVEQTFDSVHFWLHLRGGGRTVTEVPTLIVEQLNALGFVVETKRLSLPVTFLPQPWSAGWDGEGPLPVTFPLNGLNANTLYRLKVEGIIGPKKDKWLSEPRHIRTGATVPSSDTPRRIRRFIDG